MLARCHAIAEKGGGSLLELNGEADHVHLLIALPPNLDLSNLVNNLKTTRSRLLRKEFAEKVKRLYRKPVFWSRSPPGSPRVAGTALDPGTIHRAAGQPGLKGAHSEALPSPRALPLEQWAQDG